MTGQNTKPFQSISDTSELTGLSQFALRKRIREGSVKYVKSGTKFYINLPDLLRREGLSLEDLHGNSKRAD